MNWKTFVQIWVSVILIALVLLVLLGMIVSACGTPAEEEPSPEPATTEPTATVTPRTTTSPSPVPTPTTTLAKTPTPTTEPTATVTPRTTTSPSPVPTPTTQPTAIPRPTATPRSAGLGVSSRTVIQKFDELGMDVGFADAPLSGGTPRSLGINADATVIVELVGPRQNLTEATATVEFGSDADENALNGLAMLALLLTVTSWDEGTAWLTDAIGRITTVERISTTQNGYSITLEWYDLSNALYLEISR